MSQTKLLHIHPISYAIHFIIFFFTFLFTSQQILLHRKSSDTKCNVNSMSSLLNSLSLFNCLDELIILTHPRTSSLHLEFPSYPHIPSAAITFCHSMTYIGIVYDECQYRNFSFNCIIKFLFCVTNSGCFFD